MVEAGDGEVRPNDGERGGRGGGGTDAGVVDAGGAETPGRWGRGQKVAVFGLVAAVVVLRVVLALVVHGNAPERAVVDDTAGYVNPALSLVRDGEYDRRPGSEAPEFLRTPGYPAFVAAVYWLSDESNRAVVAVQAAIGGLSVLFVVLLARRLTGSFGLAMASGSLLALDPLQASQSTLIVTETLATVLTTLAAYCGVRFVQPLAAQASTGTTNDQQGPAVKWGVAFALTLALATFVRPATFYFPILVVGGLAVAALRQPERRRTIVRAGAAVALPSLVLLGGWNVRNHYEVDTLRFSGIEAVNFYWYRAGAVVADQQDHDLEAVQVRLTEELNRGVVPAFDYEDHRDGTPPPAWEHRQGEYYGRAQSEAVEILAGDPARTALQIGRGVYGQVVQSGWRNAYQELTGGRTPPLPVTALGLVVVWAIEALAFLGAAQSLRRRRDGRENRDWPVHLFVVGMTAFIVLATATGPDAAAGYRFRIPLWPIICVYAVIGARESVPLVRSLAARRRRAAIPAP